MTSRNVLRNSGVSLQFIALVTFLCCVGDLRGQITKTNIDTLAIRSGTVMKLILPGTSSASVSLPTTNGRLMLEHELSVYPVGTVTHVLSQLQIPDNYNRTDGKDVSRTEYQQLFTKIGTVYGAGNGTTTFNLPIVLAPYVPRDGLVGWWLLSGDGKDRWYHKNNGIVTGATADTDRNHHTNQALSFDGIDDEVYIQNTFFNNGWNAWSISFWVNLDTVEQSTLLNTDPEQGVKIMSTTDSKIELAVGDGLTWLSDGWLTNAEYQSNSWLHICIIRNGLSVKVYVNSVLDKEFTLPSAPPDQNASMYIGRCDCADEYATGKIDDVGVWSRALTLDEITALYKSNLSVVIRCK
jgi:hypothetical protein